MTATIGPSRYAVWHASDLGRITEDLEVRLLLDLAGPLDGRRVLDVGCGDGAFAGGLARGGADVSGVDADAAMIAAARAGMPGVKWAVGDAEHLPFPDASFDLVTAVTLLCLVGNPTRAIAEMARVTAPGGCIVLGELGRWSVWALLRRLRGLFGSRLWRAASFWTPSDLVRLTEGLPLRVERHGGAVYYPPTNRAARLLAPFDRSFSRRFGAIGAAFLAISFRKV